MWGFAYEKETPGLGFCSGVFVGLVAEKGRKCIAPYKCR
jgi:hypothetical protein